MSAVVSAGLVRDWAARALTGLGDARAEIDALNVFPVPDGDTGTNLYLTMESAVESVEECWAEPTPEVGTAAKALSMGALLGARGNSGVILSQVLRGTSEVLAALRDGEELSGEQVHALLRRAADLSYQAVAHPVEGTILTVARAAADAAERMLATGANDAAAVVSAALDGAREALDRTPSMLESLRLAGVVDAGGRGLVVVLEALAEVVSGIHRVASPSTTTTRTRPESVVAESYNGPAYEVMFLLDADEEAVDVLRATLDQLGDSLVVVGGDDTWNVHVHVDDAGAAVEAAIAAGRPYRVRITHLAPVIAVTRPHDARALVAVAHGPGVAALLAKAGVHVVPAEPRRRPSTAEILSAVDLTHADEIVVLPSDSDTRAVAEAAAEQARRSGARVSVIPTRSVVQTLAAVAVHDPGQRFDDDVVAMTRAAVATRYAAVTIASRQALTMAGACEVGDVLGLVDGDIALIGSDVETVASEILTRMLTVGGELVTIVTGSSADDELGVRLSQWLGHEWPLVDVVVYDGGQPLWPVIMGVE